MISLTEQVKKDLDNLLESNTVDVLLEKLQDEFSNIRLKNIPDESIENLKLQLETLDAKIEHVRECTSKSQILKYNIKSREKYKESLNKINNDIKEKLKKLEKLTQLKQQIDEILTDSNISLTDLKPKDYPKLKETIQTLEDKYSKLNIDYKDLPLRTKLTSVIEDRLSLFKTALKNLETSSKSKKTKIIKELPSMTIKKAEHLMEDFDENIFNQFLQELYTHWTEYGRSKRAQILTSLFKSALKNNNLTLLSQLYEKFQDNAQAKTIIDPLLEKNHYGTANIFYYIKLEQMLKKLKDEILTDSNISLTDLKPKDYPKLKETIQTLEDIYSKLNIDYKDLPLRTMLTSVIEDRLWLFKTALKILETSMTIKKAEDLENNFDENIFNQVLLKLYTDWDNYRKMEQAQILTSLVNSALKNNNNLTLLSQLYEKFQDNAQAKSIIDPLLKKEPYCGENILYYIKIEPLLKKFVNASESVLKTYNAQSFKEIAQMFDKIWSNTNFVVGKIKEFQIQTLENLIKSASSAEDMGFLKSIINSEFPETARTHNFYIKYAQFKNPIAMRFVAGRALLGQYQPYDKSIPWAIECLGYLETSVIPNLEEQLTKDPGNQDLNEEIQELKKGIERARLRIQGLGHDEKIPERDSPEFNTLVEKTIEKCQDGSKYVFVPVKDFNLSSELFKPKLTQESIINFNNNEHIETKEYHSPTPPHPKELHKTPSPLENITETKSEEELEESEFDTLIKESESLIKNYDPQKFNQIATRLKEIMHPIIARVGKIHDPQRVIFANLLKSAKSAQEMEEIKPILTCLDRETNIAYNFYMKYAQFQNPFAMRFVAGCALLGYYQPYEKSIPWAIECLGYLNTHVIPNLEKKLEENPNNQDLEKEIQDLKEGIERARLRIQGLGHDEKIPEYGSERFNELVDSTIANLSSLESKITSLDDFNLSRELVKKPTTKDDWLEAAQNKELSFEERVNALSEFLKLHKGALKASPAGIMTIQSQKILAITTALIQNAQTTEQLTMLDPIIKRFNVPAINENFSTKMISIQNVTTPAATHNTEQNVTTPIPLENTGQGENEDMNSQGLKSEKKSVGVFQKHLDENMKIKDRLLKSSFTNVDQHFDAIQNAMQIAISGLSKSRFLTDKKQKLLQEAKIGFDHSPTLDNLQTFLAICQAHRSSAKLSLFGSSETHSFTAFKNALTNDLKKEMFPEAEPKPWFNIRGRKK